MSRDYLKLMELFIQKKEMIGGFRLKAWRVEVY
jgi:hypothetical protein